MRLHWSFSHFAIDKLYNYLELVCPWETNQRTKEILDLKSNKPDDSQRISNTPVCFHISFPSEGVLTFGSKLSIYLMFLDEKAAVHVVDTVPRFSAATNLNSAGADYGQSVKGIWMTFIFTWSTMYTGYANRLRTDQGFLFSLER